MALTRYTINQITDSNGILGDNVDGDISAQDLRDAIWTLYNESLDLVNNIPTGGGSQSLSDTLSIGSTTSGNDLIISNSDKIRFYDGSFYGDFILGSISSNVEYTLPTSSGTLALTSDIPFPGTSGIYSGSGTVPSSTRVSIIDNLSFFYDGIGSGTASIKFNLKSIFGQSSSFKSVTFQTNETKFGDIDMFLNSTNDDGDKSNVIGFRHDPITGVADGTTGLKRSQLGSIIGKLSWYGYETGDASISESTRIDSVITDFLSQHGEIRFFNKGSLGFTQSAVINEDGNLGLNVLSPTELLHVNDGNLRYSNGTEEEGYILTSDENGVASWTSSSNVGDGNGIYSGSGTVSVKTTVNLDGNDIGFVEGNEAFVIRDGGADSSGPNGSIALSGSREGLYWEGSAPSDGNISLKFPTPGSFASYTQTLQEADGALALLSDISPTYSLSEVLAQGNNTNGQNINVEPGDELRVNGTLSNSGEYVKPYTKYATNGSISKDSPSHHFTTTGGNINMTMFASPTNGQCISFICTDDSGNTVTINRNGTDFAYTGVGSTSSVVLTGFESISFQYDSTVGLWLESK